MKQHSKFSLAIVILIVAAFGFGFICFLSLNFSTLGNTQPSLIKALAITLTLAAFALAAMSFKEGIEKFERAIILERVSLVLFLGVAIYALSVFSHFFSVLDRKAEIQNEMSQNLVQGKEMFTNYQTYAETRKTNYESTLNSVAAAKNSNPSDYNAFGFDDRPHTQQIETKMFTLDAKLFPSNYIADKNMASKWLNELKDQVESDWSFTFGIINMINKAPSEVEDWEKNLKDQSTYRASNETTEDFDYPLSFQDVKDQLTKKHSFTPLSTGLALLAYAMMLLPYMVAIRSSKNPFSLLSFIKNRDKGNQGNNGDDLIW